MVVLAQQIAKETEKLEKYLKDNNLPLPSFDADAPSDFPKLPEDIAKSRLNIIFATKELRDLTIGPREGLRWGVWDVRFLPPLIFAPKVYSQLTWPSTLMSWLYSWSITLALVYTLSPVSTSYIGGRQR